MNLHSPVHSHLRAAIEKLQDQQVNSIMAGLGGFSVDEEAFKALAFYSTLCILKMFLVTSRVLYLRTVRRVYALPEDDKFFGKKPNEHTEDADVARTNRCQQNNIQNIPLFILLGLFLVLTGSNYQNAVMHFRIFTVTRVLYDICYIFAVPAPSRACCFAVGFFVNVSMILQILAATMS